MPRPGSHSFVPPFAQPRRRWRAADARAVLDRLQESGLSARSFAMQEGLNVQRLYKWQRALAGREGGPTAPAFVEVVGGGAAPLEVVLRSGVVLRVPVGFDGETVRRLVEILEKQSSRC